MRAAALNSHNINRHTAAQPLNVVDAAISDCMRVLLHGSHRERLRETDENEKPSTARMENRQPVYFIVYLFSFSRPISCSNFNFNRPNRVHRDHIHCMLECSITQ